MSERVRKLVHAAQQIATDAALHDRIAASTGLSIEGVRFAIDRCLENPTDAEIDALSAPSPDGERGRTYVLLSSTVFTAALRAIAVAWAGAPVVVVRPSHRAPEFAEALVRAVGDPSLVLAPNLDIAEIDRGEVHVHGRMETIARVRGSVRPGVIVRGHGPGMGIAVLGLDAAIESACDLAADVVPFDQRGCLSPRIVYVPGGLERARTFAQALSEALDRHPVPLGALFDEERTEGARFIQAVSFAGVVNKGPGGVVGLSESPVLPPTGRHVNVVSGELTSALDPLLAPHVTTVGVCGDVDPAIFPPHARIARFGWMHRPPFDGPVDRRTP